MSETNLKIKKATDILWKFFWFCFYLIIAPFIISLICYSIFLFIIGDIYVVLGFSVIIFMFSILFFYKTFDNYRKNSFFKRKDNNLNARIHILYLITILSLIITPIFILISPEDYRFDYLPIISFCILYNIIWFYYYFQPIDFFSELEDSFKHEGNFKTSIKQYHNLIILINYIAHIIFLSIIFYIKFSWLFVLITNFIFYLITIIVTKNLRSKIKKTLKKKNQSYKT